MACFCHVLEPALPFVKIHAPFEYEVEKENTHLLQYRFAEKYGAKPPRCITVVTVESRELIRISNCKLERTLYKVRSRVGLDGSRCQLSITFTISHLMEFLSFVEYIRRNTAHNSIYFNESYVFLFHANIGVSIVKRNLNSIVYMCHDEIQPNTEELILELLNQGFHSRKPFRNEIDPYFTHASFIRSTLESVTVALDVCICLISAQNDILNLMC